jgi:hypothetical protein
MASHSHFTKQNIGGTIPEQIRREWASFQVWYTAMREEEENHNLYEKSANTTERNKPRQWFSNAVLPTPEGREIWRKALVEGRVTTRAQEEWQRRLDNAGLKMEQWTNITLAENTAVAVTLWGSTVEEDTEDFAGSDSSDETETDIEFESVASTPSPKFQLWTPPDIVRVPDLPLHNAHPTPAMSNRRTTASDKKSTAQRALPVLKQPNSRVTTKATLVRSRKAPNGEEPVIHNEASQTGDAAAEAQLRLGVYARLVPTSVEDWASSKSSSDDDSELLVTSNEITDDEFYQINRQDETERAVPENKIYIPWRPNTTFPLNTPHPSNPPVAIQTKPSSQPHRPKASAKTHLQSNTIQSQAVTTPTIHPSNTNPSVQESEEEQKGVSRKQIEDFLIFMANEDFQKKLTEAQPDTTSWKHICRIADGLYRDQMEQERQQLHGAHGGSSEHRQSSEGVPKQATQGEFSPKARSHPDAQDRSPRAADPTKPLTPPHTPQPGTRYIGPVLTDDEKKDEVAAFENFSLAVRKQKIQEFHKEAEIKELDLAERFHVQEYDKKTTWEILKQHELAMEDLKKVKDNERRGLCAAERERRKAEIAARVRDKHAGEQHDAQGIQQKRREEKMETQAKRRWAKAGTPRGSENSRGQTTAGVVTNLESLDAPSRQQYGVTGKGESSGMRIQTNGRRTENLEGSAGLFFMELADPRGKGARVDEASLDTNDLSRTPWTSSVLLPELNSDTDGEGESLAPNPIIKDHKHVHFTPSVLADDSDADSSDTDRPFSNSLESAGPGPGITRGQGAMSHGLGIGEGPSGRPTTRSRKPAMTGPKHRSPAIWHPPVEKESKGKEWEVLPDSSPIQSQQGAWRNWA